MSFKTFLTNMQVMFIGFKDNNKILTEGQKIRLLFQKVQSPSLTQVKNSLQVSYDLDKAGEGTYDVLANSMAAKAASLPDHAPNRQASSVDRHPMPGWPQQVESRVPTEISSLDSTRTSGAYLTMSRRQFWTRESASTSTPRRVLVAIPKRARLVPSKSIRTVYPR
jgi:hypothetical protein